MQQLIFSTGNSVPSFKYCFEELVLLHFHATLFVYSAFYISESNVELYTHYIFFTTVFTRCFTHYDVTYKLLSSKMGCINSF